MPYVVTPAASDQFGATAIKSRSTNQTHTSMATEHSALTPDSTQPVQVSFLQPPAKSSSRATGPLCFFSFIASFLLMRETSFVAPLFVKYS